MRKTKTASGLPSSSTVPNVPPREQALFRAIPIQARAKRSVEHILSTAAKLLDEVGLDGFNTNLLAERAEVRVRTIYRYFPDKYAVIVALASRMFADWDAWMDTVFSKLADPKQEWEPVQRQIIPQLLRQTKDQPGGIAAAKALGVIPELTELDTAALERTSEKMSAALKKRGVRLSPARLLNISRVSMLTVNSGVDLYFRLGEAQRAPYLAELINMQIAYLRLYLD